MYFWMFHPARGQNWISCYTSLNRYYTIIAFSDPAV